MLYNCQLRACSRTKVTQMHPSAGVTLPLLSQSIILFQIGLSYLVLKKNLEKEQVSCCSSASWTDSSSCHSFQLHSLLL